MSRFPLWPADGLAVLALLATSLAAYGLLLDPSRMLADYDALVYFYPLRAFAAAAIQDGRLPLWNPSSFLGVPFIANPQTAVFYPPTWAFFILSVPYAYSLNLVGHVLLAGVGFYLFCRYSLNAAPPAALIGGLTFMLSGALSGQYGHLNQVSAAAWLPLILLATERAVVLKRVGLAVVAGLLLGVQLLAGHPQQSYMTLIATGLVALWRAWPQGLRGLGRALFVGTTVVLCGVAVAAVQLIPTLELARESIRGSGLGYRDAVAGSLWPWLVARALLPSYANDLGSTEYLGYIGVVPLLLSAVAIGAVRPARLVFGLSLAGLGLFLALGGANPVYPTLYAIVPGLASFRVPARWLLLYTIGIASLTAIGMDWLLRQAKPRLAWRRFVRLAGTVSVLVIVLLAIYLGGVRVMRSVQLVWLGLLLGGGVLAVGAADSRTRRLAVPLLVVLIMVELWGAGADLQPRTPALVEAYSQPRDSTLFVQSRLAGSRFLSLASEEYELKETPDYREWLSDLPEPALLGFLVAAKRNEVMTPNLNLLYQIDSLDGYDGGVLPPQRYLGLGGLLTGPERMRPDGVLISRLESLPPRQLMDLFNLKVVLAGRSKDHESGGVRYDRSVVATLSPGEQLTIERVPERSYTSVGLISALGAEALDGAAVAEIELQGVSGSVETVPIVMGRHTATARGPAEPGLEIVRPGSWVAEGDPVEYLARVPIPRLELARVSIRNRSDAPYQVRALTLIDETDGATTSLVLDDRLERTEFFDMKVYEYPDVLPRAYLVQQVVEAEDDEALRLLGSPTFEPGRVAVVPPGTDPGFSASDERGEQVHLVEQTPERVRISAVSDTGGLLVLSDTYYPGWRVHVNGVPSTLLRVNVGLRGVALPPGAHEVTFSYEPTSIRFGAAITLGSLAILLVGLVSMRCRGRGRRGSGWWTHARR